MVDFRYELIERIGRNGEGTVWLANDWRLGRDVALKRPGLTDGLDPEDTDRLTDAFVANALTAMTLNHPHLVSIHDAAEDRQGPYLVMEYLKAPPLSSLVDGLQPAKILEFGGQISDGLSALHGAGVVHGDVKAENILVGSLGAVLVDFGWSELGTIPDTSSGSVVAPEVLAGENPGPASDIYSLGAALDRLVEPHRKAGGGVTAEVDQLLQSAMNPNPAKRPDATTMAANLFSLVGRTDVTAVDPVSTNGHHVDTDDASSTAGDPPSGDDDDQNPVDPPLVEGHGSTIVGDASTPIPASSPAAPAPSSDGDTIVMETAVAPEASTAAPLSSTFSSTSSDQSNPGDFETLDANADYQTSNTGDFEPSTAPRRRGASWTTTAIMVTISAMVLVVAGLILSQLTNNKQEDYTSVQAVPDVGGSIGSRPSGEEPSTGDVEDSNTAEDEPDKIVVASTPSTTIEALTTTIEQPPSTVSTTTEAPTTTPTTGESTTTTEATTTTAPITTAPPTTAPTTTKAPTTAAPVTTAGPPINLSLRSRPNQSSVDYGGLASRAVDGNTNGQWGAASISGTRAEVQPWWQTDLGFPARIDQVVIYNRVDCCSDRLSNFSVFVSENSMRGKSLDQLTADRSIARFHIDKLSGNSITIPINASGRYVRVQLEGQTQQILSLAEIEIIGVPE